MLENNQKEIILLKDLGMLYPKIDSNQKKKYGLYKCFCGNEFKSQMRHVKNKVTVSCGCFHKENHTKHGLAKHRLYNTWSEMISRCSNIKNKDYVNYGARGITICERWLKVENFIEDMYPAFIEGLTLDRKNLDGNYEKDNCRWTTKSVQARNTRKIRSTNTTGYRGVRKHNSKFRAYIAVDYKQIHLGIFENKIDAAKAYDSYVIQNNLEHTKNFE